MPNTLTREPLSRILGQNRLKIQVVCLLLICCSVTGFSKNTSDTLSLAGDWRFAMDPDDTGIDHQWYKQLLDQQIILPGILQSQGFGNPINTRTPWQLSLHDRRWYLRRDFKIFTEPGNVKIPFLSQPPRHYLGVAWYQRDINIPEEWRGRRVELKLERTRWQTTVWLDENKIGSQDSLVVPHYYELGTIKPGNHQLTIRVDNRMLMDYRPDAHSVSDSLGSTWNGIVGQIQLFSTPPVWIDHVKVTPDIHKKSVSLDVQIGNITGKVGRGTISAGEKCSKLVSWTQDGGQATIELPLGSEAELWSEFNPKLHECTVMLQTEEFQDRYSVKFGLREISTDDDHFLINGNKSHFRGTHSGGDFPETGYPATDVAYWRQLFAICQKWGLNHMRFHSFCPPEAAFVAADEMGFYLQPECGMWNVFDPGTEMVKRVYEEADRMIREYGNHPSFILFSPSNEPKGDWKKVLPSWVKHFRNKDPRRLYTPNTGRAVISKPGPLKGKADYLATHDIGDRLRGSRGWFGRTYLSSLSGVDVPVIAHEVGQWCAYPDFDIIVKFDGCYLEPGNFEIFRDLMKQAGLQNMNEAFANESGYFQSACYKEEIEANLRTPGLSGFQLLDLHDYLGQGTALVGVLDAFWEEKGYITAEQWRRFCNTTVPLAVLKKRVFTSDDLFETDIQVAHYGPSILQDVTVYWKINDTQGKTVQKGQWPIEQIERGSAIPLGKVKADLSDLQTPAKYKLIVGLAGTEFENDWDFWVYPSAINTDIQYDILMTRSFEQADKALKNGKKVLFMPMANQLRWDCPPIGFEPIFWNRLMGPNWERFLGLVCDPSHPALENFPTDSYYNWQWRDVFHPYSRAVNISRLPKQITPIVQIIDGWTRNYPLAALFECSVGSGQLIVCAADLESNLANRPPAAQLRKTLLDYMASDAFQPSVNISSQQLRDLHLDNQLMKKLGCKAMSHIGPESENYPASDAIDGNPNTYWDAAKQGQNKSYPHELILRFPEPVEMTGLILMNRQNHRGHKGDIREYRIEISLDGQKWSLLKQGQLESTWDPQTIRFKETIRTSFVKIRALSGFGTDPSASIAEIAVIYAGPPLDKMNNDQVGPYLKTGSATEEMAEATDLLQYSTNISAVHVAEITADSESMTDPAEHAMDGDPRTFWHTEWREKAPDHPHWLMLELKAPMMISGIRYLPRQDGDNGWIKDYIVEISDDGKQWRQVKTGRFERSKDLQTVVFSTPVKAHYLRLTAQSESKKQAFSSVAEISIIEK